VGDGGSPLRGALSFSMRVNFLTTTNTGNGYGMTREYFKKFLPKFGVELDPANAGNDYTLILHVPPAIQFAKGKKILYTMLEGDEVPNSWKVYLSMADHIIVPSTFVQQTFKKSGFDSVVVPLGYDGGLFNYEEKPIHEPYTFLHYEAFQKRKGWEDVLEAWLLSGLAEEELECQLVLKTIIEPKEVCKLTEEMFIPNNVKIVCGELPHKCIRDILDLADCFVFPSHGEGFSLPPLEAMACGLPTIITIGHSHSDFFNSDFMYGVPADIQIPARYDNWENQGHFARCSAERLGWHMKYIYDHKEEARAVGKNSSEYVKKYEYNVSMKKLADYILGRFL
jgi:hypothetical protein